MLAKEGSGFYITCDADPRLTEDELDEIRQIAKDMIETLKKEKLVFDWKQNQQTRADVHTTIK